MTNGQNSKSPKPGRDLLLGLAAVAALALLGIGFWEIKIILAPAGGIGIPTVDLYQMFLPWYTHMAASLRNLSLPLWFPNVGTGVPFVANPQTAVFYPPNLLYVILPTAFCMGLLAQFHLILAGVGMYGFCRLHSLRRLASLLGGISYMLSYTVWSNYGVHYLAGVAWLPVIFYFGEKLYLHPTIRNSMLLAIGASLQFLSGGTQLFLYTTYFLALYLALRLILYPAARTAATKKFHVPIYFSLSMFLVMLICGIQLLPSMELLRHSVRASNLSAETVHFMGLHFEWWWPFTNLLYSKWNRLFGSTFHQGGLLQILLVMCALTRYRDRKMYIFVVLMILSVLLSTGYSTPLYQYFAMLPGVGQSRQPSRLAVVTAFTCSFLAAVGIETCLNAQTAERRERLLMAVKLIAVASVFGIVLWVAHTHGNIVSPILGFIILLTALLIPKRPLLLVAGTAILCISIWEMGVQNKVTSSHPQALPEYLGQTERKMLADLPALVGSERIFVEERGIPPRPFPTYRVAVQGVSSVADYYPAVSSRMEDIIEAVTGLKPLYPDGRIELKPQATRPDIFNVLSVRYFLVHEGDNIFQTAVPNSPMAQFGSTLKKVLTYPGYVLYENENALPRAYMVHAAQVADNRYDSLRDVLSESFAPHSAVVMEGEKSREVLPLLSSDLGSSANAVQIVSRSPNLVLIDVSSEKGGIVVLTDSYYPGWVATVDGKRTPVYRANYLFRSVYVPAGNHRIVFSYKPKSFLFGLLLSVTGICVLLAGLILARRKRSFS